MHSPNQKWGIKVSRTLKMNPEKNMAETSQERQPLLGKGDGDAEPRKSEQV